MTFTCCGGTHDVVAAAAEVRRDDRCQRPDLQDLWDSVTGKVISNDCAPGSEQRHVRPRSTTVARPAARTRRPGKIRHRPVRATEPPADGPEVRGRVCGRLLDGHVRLLRFRRALATRAASRRARGDQHGGAGLHGQGWHRHARVHHFQGAALHPVSSRAPSIDTMVTSRPSVPVSFCVTTTATRGSQGLRRRPFARAPPRGRHPTRRRPSTKSPPPSSSRPARVARR